MTTGDAVDIVVENGKSLMGIGVEQQTTRRMGRREAGGREQKRGMLWITGEDNAGIQFRVRFWIQMRIADCGLN